MTEGFDPTAGAFSAVCSLRKSDEVPATYVAEPYLCLDGEPDNDDMSVASTVTQSSALPPDIGTASLPDRTLQWTWSVDCNGFDPTRALDVVDNWLWDRRRAQVRKYPQDRGEMVQKLARRGPHNAEFIEMMLDQSDSWVSGSSPGCIESSRPHGAVRAKSSADTDEVADQLGNLSIGNGVLGT